MFWINKKINKIDIPLKCLMLWPKSWTFYKPCSFHIFAILMNFIKIRMSINRSNKYDIIIFYILTCLIYLFIKNECLSVCPSVCPPLCIPKRLDRFWWIFFCVFEWYLRFFRSRYFVFTYHFLFFKWNGRTTKLISKSSVFLMQNIIHIIFVLQILYEKKKFFC